MSLKDAFNALLAMQSRSMTLKRAADEITVKAAPSNYSRNLAGPSDIAIKGREFVISKDDLVTPLTKIRRGDSLIDVDFGTMAVTEVIEMYDLGGAVIGFRVRVE